jgi:hypothetical protein
MWLPYLRTNYSETPKNAGCAWYDCMSEKIKYNCNKKEGAYVAGVSVLEELLSFQLVQLHYIKSERTHVPSDSLKPGICHPK